MGECEKCGGAIDDKYKYCLKCLDEIKKSNKGVDNKELLKALGQINNNLYYLRRAFGVLLLEKYGKEIKWDKGKKDFVETEVKK